MADIVGSAFTLTALVVLGRDGLAPWEAVLATTGANFIVWFGLAILSLAVLRPALQHVRREARGLLMKDGRFWEAS